MSTGGVESQVSIYGSVRLKIRLLFISSRLIINILVCLIAPLNPFCILSFVQHCLFSGQKLQQHLTKTDVSWWYRIGREWILIFTI